LFAAFAAVVYVARSRNRKKVEYEPNPVYDQKRAKFGKGNNHIAHHLRLRAWSGK